MILQQLKADYKRIFSSPKMYLSILGVVLLCYIYKYRKIYTWQCRYILHIGYFNWVERFQKIDNYFFGAALCDRFL